ncbi:hypothetical protein CCICO_04895 [Corynebacterium ciconiae DSM 44920]|uniref:hypothetical protein n=1 Tax=Corynebacterium ciconiae TaxID=227319 RepID=UPI0003723E20|nr:hypothetical protein [Corynebacterium ciconiae]WKD61015.1 hypothetical protein CCICO_04895 [Corynebacterium ciconiae DSM 44920]
MVAYAVGPMPGLSLIDAASVIEGETGEHRAIPQLPQRGLGSDAIGRTASLLEGLAFSRGPRSWRMDARPQIASRRTLDRTERDLDELESCWGTTVGGVIKQQIIGPWSLAASIELSNGQLLLRDPGALRDLHASLNEGIARHIADIRKRYYASVWLQIDEPLLEPIVRGTLTPATTLDPIPALHREELAPALGALGASADRRILHVPKLTPDHVRLGMAHDAILSSPSGWDSPTKDAVAEAIEQGTSLGLKLVRSDDRVDDLGECPRSRAQEVAGIIDELALARSVLTDSVDIAPAEDLSHGDLLGAAGQLAVARVVSDMLTRDAGDL